MSSTVMLMNVRRFVDERGWFSEVYNKRIFAERGVEDDFVQDNHSLSMTVGTLRGLHFQAPPFAQAKLIRCVRGRIFDVVVDIRRGSPTYGQWVSAELSDKDGRELYVPVGFAHGFVTLEPATEVTYKVSEFYSPAHDGGLLWSDPLIGIEWPLPAGVEPVLSERDGRQASLAAFESPFAYDGTPLSLVEV